MNYTYTSNTNTSGETFENMKKPGTAIIGATDIHVSFHSNISPHIIVIKDKVRKEYNIKVVMKGSKTILEICDKQGRTISD